MKAMEKEKIKSWTPGLRDSHHTTQANPFAAKPGYATPVVKAFKNLILGMYPR
jgi:hypothetical protein